MRSAPALAAILSDRAYYLRRWGVVEHWALNEASGAATASISSSNNLTDNNTVTSNAGKVPAGVQAGQFTAANSEYLSIADNAAMSTGDIDFGGAIWFKPTTLTGDIMNKGTQTGVPTNDEYILRIGGTGTLTLFIGGASYKSVALGASTITAGAWNFAVWAHDAVGDLLWISANGGAFTTAATAGVAPSDTTAGFTIGGLDIASPTNFANGVIGPVVFFKSPPGGIAGIATEIRDRLYASGNGVPYNELVSSEKTAWGLVSWWAIDESSGSRADSHGANTLTDNNTVTAQAFKGSALARQFTAANGEYLSLADNAAVSIGDVDCWWAFWFMLDADDANERALVSKGTGGAGGEYYIAKNTSKQLIIQARNSADSATATATAITFGALSPSTWYFGMAYHDSVNDLLGISVNGGAFDTTAITGGILDAAIAFQIGRRVASGTYWDGRIGPVMFGKSPPGGIAGLRNEIRDRLYNNGTGRAWPFR